MSSDAGEHDIPPQTVARVKAATRARFMEERVRRVLTRRNRPPRKFDRGAAAVAAEAASE